MQSTVVGHLEEIREARLQVDLAVSLAPVTLELGLASLRIEQGVLIPATPVAGEVRELLFLGEALWLLTPPDEVEAGQLELFTEARQLEERIDSMILVVADGQVSRKLLDRDPTQLSPAMTTHARDLFTEWRSSGQWRQLRVEGALLRAAMADPIYNGFVLASLNGRELGDFLYLVEPDVEEQVSLGQFVELELTEKERRKALREISRQQRRGRLVGVEVEDLGQWDSWVSASLRGEDGAARPGLVPFEAEHYGLEVSLDGRKLNLSGRAELRLKALADAATVVRLEMNRDLQVSTVRAADGSALAFHQAGEETLVFLPEAPAAGKGLVLEVEYSGRFIDKLESGIFLLRDTLYWHPHVGELDRATYDVRFEWPDRLELIAGGLRTEGGESSRGRRWERRVQTLPSLGLTFEVGKFRTLRRKVGHVEVEVAVDRLIHRFDRDIGERLLTSVADSLEYFESIFGPYPLDEMRVVTTYRSYSQATLGFLTLSNLMVLNDRHFNRWLGLEDYRTVIAHEVAHQWWGHMVGWSSYRDQWISEALANYSAALYAEHRLKGQRLLGSGPLSGWQDDLLASLEDGRPVEALGPVVLGERLVSSVSSSGYLPIVYSKGAIVFNMIERMFGKDRFVEMLRSIAELASYRSLSTETFLIALENASGQDLEAFAEQFIYGTGLPEVYYTYRFEQDEQERWWVRGEARQSPPYRYRYEVVERPSGGLDVARKRIDQVGVERSSLPVPVQIMLFDPERVREGKSEDEARLAHQWGNIRWLSYIWLVGEITSLDLQLELEPRELVLDPDSEVFARFFNQRRHPKRALFYQALDAAAAGEREQASELGRQALAARVASGPGLAADPPADEERTPAADRLNGSIYLLLARVALDAGDTRSGREHYEQAARLLEKSQSARMLEVTEARLLLHEGRVGEAHRRLRRGLLRKQRLDSTEAWLLLGIAAREMGRPEEVRMAIEKAESVGAGVGLLKGF